MGCARTYAVQVNIVTDGERTPLTVAPEFSVGQWSRLADETSIAEIFLPSGTDCNNFLAQLWPHLGRVEIALIRDGVLVWAGPITNIAYVSPTEPVHIIAQDNTYSLTRRFTLGDLTASGDVATIAADTLELILTDDPATGLDPDPMLVVPYMNTETVGETIEYENDGPTAAIDVLDDLTDYGLTWTVVNHRLILGPRPNEDTPIAEYLTEADFTGALAYEIDLDDVVTYATAVSSDDDTSDQTQAVDVPYSVPALGVIVDVGDTTAAATMQLAARRALSWPPRPTLTSQQPGDLVADLDINRMIPGRVVWEVQTDFLGLPVIERMALESIDVVFHPDGTETISPGLTPITRVEAQ